MIIIKFWTAWEKEEEEEEGKDVQKTGTMQAIICYAALQ